MSRIHAYVMIIYVNVCWLFDRQKRICACLCSYL